MLLVAAASLLCVASAQARPPAVHFIWQRPAGSLCPTREALQADVEALMGRRVFAPRGDAQLIVRGAVEDGADGVHVHLEALDARGEVLGTRALTAPAGDCASMRSTIGLVLTLFVEYEVPEDDTVLGVGAEMSLAHAPLPRMAFAVGPALYLALGSVVQLHASAAYWLPVSIQTPRGVGAQLEAFSLELRGCARVWAGLGLCTGFESGALIASPLKLRGPSRQVRLLAHALLEASWELELNGLARIDAAIGSLLSLSRPEFSYQTGDGERRAVYRPQVAGIIFRLTIMIPTE